jgi:DNA-binding GntR family transcriptional regulator
MSVELSGATVAAAIKARRRRNDAVPGLKPTAAELAYQVLRQQILNSDLQPGSIVSERLLAQRLNVGKAPIRVAVQRLASEGFISIEPRRGIIVCPQSIQDVVDLFQIRVLIEQLCVRSIAGKLTATQTATLLASVEELRRIAESSDPTETITSDFAFHRLLCEFHGNRQLMSVLDRILDSLYREIRLAQVKHPVRVWDSLKEHEELAEAIINGPPDAAERLIVKHLAFGEQFVLSRRPS